MDNMTDWRHKWLTGRSVVGLCLLVAALPHLLVASLINIESLKARALEACTVGADCANPPLVNWCGEADASHDTGHSGLVAWLVNRASMWRRESDLARLRDWEDELTRPAVQRNLPYDLATLRSAIVWRLPCNAAVLQRARGEAATGGLQERALLSELSERRGEFGVNTVAGAAVQADLVSRERAAVAAAMGSSSDGFRLGEDLLVDTGRCVSGVRAAADALWSGWKYDEDTRFRPAMFAIGWDCYNSYSGTGALRATGLWLDRTSDRWPARATFVPTSAIKVSTGPYLFSVVYRTDGSRDGAAAVALDPLVAWWELPASEGAWTHAAVLAWSPNVGDLKPLLSNAGEGTVRFGEVRVRPIYVRGNADSRDRSTKYLLWQ